MKKQSKAASCSRKECGFLRDMMNFTSLQKLWKNLCLQGDNIKPVGLQVSEEEKVAPSQPTRFTTSGRVVTGPQEALGPEAVLRRAVVASA